jgi:hypothetical protein
VERRYSISHHIRADPVSPTLPPHPFFEFVRQVARAMISTTIEYAQQFDRSITIKKATDAADKTARLYFREGEVWWVRLGKNIGSPARQHVFVRKLKSESE